MIDERGQFGPERDGGGRRRARVHGYRAGVRQRQHHAQSGFPEHAEAMRPMYVSLADLAGTRCCGWLYRPRGARHHAEHGDACRDQPRRPPSSSAASSAYRRPAHCAGSGASCSPPPPSPSPRRPAAGAEGYADTAFAQPRRPWPRCGGGGRVICPRPPLPAHELTGCGRRRGAGGVAGGRAAGTTDARRRPPARSLYHWRSWPNSNHIRNFSIIAHIDHGKSTLADRLLELTGTVAARDMKEQLLDKMDLRRERGITIKARLPHRLQGARRPRVPAQPHRHPRPRRLHLRGLPSLAACEGAVLLVDSTQGVEAQTLANAYLAIENDLKSSRCPKDRPAGQRRGGGRARAARAHRRDARGDPRGVGQDRRGVEDVLEAVVTRDAAAGRRPRGAGACPDLRQRVRPNRGAIADVRVVDGGFSRPAVA